MVTCDLGVTLGRQSRAQFFHLKSSLTHPATAEAVELQR
jgi:hypothetical protein